MERKSDKKLKIHLDKPRYYSLKNTVISHGWVNLSPFLWHDGVLKGVVYNGGAWDFEIKENPGHIEVALPSLRDDMGVDALMDHFSYMLHLDFPVFEFIDICDKLGRDDLREMACEGWGRLLRGCTVWEDAVKTLLTTNSSWGNTQRMVDRLCQVLGKESPQGYRAFPSPDDVLRNKQQVIGLGLGYRAEYLVEFAERVASGNLEIERLAKGRMSRDEAVLHASSIKGFGDYAANHLLVLCGWTEFMAIDREVLKYLGIPPTKGGRVPKNIRCYDEFRNFRYTAYKLERIRRRKNWIG